MGGVFTKMIERNTTIPTKKSQVYSTAADGQTQVDVHVLQGEREMAAYNKSLGNFILDGIAPAPRGVPQIEVTFDIDANGIVHVSAKDLGTGREQKITITASSNLSEADINAAVKEAELHAAEDKKRKEEIETKNHAETSVYQTEKTLNELGDKVTAEDKAPVEAALASLKSAIAANDYEKMKTETEAVQQAFYKVSEKLYAGANPGAAQGQPNPQDFAGGNPGASSNDGGFKNAGGDF
jgi:molecular chaperone DnaK